MSRKKTAGVIINRPAVTFYEFAGVYGVYATFSAGAVAILMMSRQNPVRKLADKAANKAKDLAWKMEDKMNQMDL